MFYYQSLQDMLIMVLSNRRNKDPNRFLNLHRQMSNLECTYLYKIDSSVELVKGPITLFANWPRSLSFLTMISRLHILCCRNTSHILNCHLFGESELFLIENPHCKRVKILSRIASFQHNMK